MDGSLEGNDLHAVVIGYFSFGFAQFDQMVRDAVRTFVKAGAQSYTIIWWFVAYCPQLLLSTAPAVDFARTIAHQSPRILCIR